MVSNKLSSLAANWWRKCALILLVLLALVTVLASFAPRHQLPQPKQQFPLHPVELAGNVRTGKILRVAGAKNEYLSLHFQITGADLDSFQVRLNGKEGKEPGAPLKCQFFQVLCAPPASARDFQADALLPLKGKPQFTGEPLEIWATIKVPAAGREGIYPYEIIFTDKRGTFRQPLELRIWNFVLSDDLPITILANLHYDRKFFFRYGVKSLDQFDQMLRHYLATMRQYKINALARFYPFPTDKLQPGVKVEDFPRFHRMLQYALNNLHYRFFRVPFFPGAKELDRPGNKFTAQARSFYPLFVDYLKRHHLENQAIIKVIDEPKPEYHPQVLKAYALIKSLAPGIKTECAGGAPYPDLAKVIDIWVTYAGYFNASKIAEAQAQGQEIWLYANKLHGLDQPLVNQRLIGWYIHRHDFKGYLFWGLNWWPQDPWTYPADRQNSFRRGTFFYPHPQTGEPVATTRLEAIREGFQDYQYLTLLAQAHQRRLVPTDTFQELSRKVAQVTENMSLLKPQVTMLEMDQLRGQIAGVLDHLGSRLHE